jgi:hypothetical protein
MRYIAKVGLANDATGMRYQPGAMIVDGDFPADVIVAWLEDGTIEPAPVEKSGRLGPVRKLNDRAGGE